MSIYLIKAWEDEGGDRGRGIWPITTLKGPTLEELRKEIIKY